MKAARKSAAQPAPPPPKIRRVRAQDIGLVIALDRKVTGIAKPRYWREVFERYGRRRQAESFFLVAEPGKRDEAGHIIGFIIGEVRAWEFGSAPCGWVFALSVEPAMRQHGVGEALFNTISVEFRKAGMSKMRTMVDRDNPLPLLFFRGEGMMAGPYIQLEKDIA